MDFWTRLQRIATRLETPRMKTIEEMILPRRTAGAEAHRVTSPHRDVGAGYQSESPHRG